VRRGAATGVTHARVQRTACEDIRKSGGRRAAKFVAGTSIGFLVAVTDAVAPASVTPAIHEALARLEGTWAAS